MNKLHFRDLGGYRTAAVRTVKGTLERAVEEYGSMQGYIRDALGLTDAEIEQLRDQFLEANGGER